MILFLYDVSCEGDEENVYREREREREREIIS